MVPEGSIIFMPLLHAFINVYRLPESWQPDSAEYSTIVNYLRMPLLSSIMRYTDTSVIYRQARLIPR
jgi:hypothetical protein